MKNINTLLMMTVVKFCYIADESDQLIHTSYMVIHACTHEVKKLAHGLCIITECFRIELYIIIYAHIFKQKYGSLLDSVSRRSKEILKPKF